MAHCDFSSISAIIYERCFKQRRLRMYATGRTPLFELEPLPSGGYRQLKCRNDLRNYCFRNSCVKLLNSILQLKILNETALMLTLCILWLLVYWLFLHFLSHFYCSDKTKYFSKITLKTELTMYLKLKWRSMGIWYTPQRLSVASLLTFKVW